ncbi:MAG: phosphoribosylaminoimidazolesuccinocarboxamide synthase [Deltaproteobacteria bacterium]|jgi:phosphoribosylaminoimidazole-succinocarboxamide synthase|nr:phosphoribosylaminoimidazolesuccinocarboxamide synthase [Deltaproteobacteria bacterium]MBT4263964.1 phosphoribosylaminoimidazolesuccinocarboxamide synthase [Deltaproteobacteria bacterium]MBT4639907.1 phosphoribosylaminoimidazolesuccinocarboxamide synthase [Deltaproteobacteria bacterium]MBT6498519.1 phosphoribosylaminoimidazolesuccinocarboxamide synthase [Deltaproteobacteria bacterium]MBT6616181.1 phosphoribosylaminoimidazolesuccinocarboxamide synthase [Deltaproteobacteria bacterium]
MAPNKNDTLLCPDLKLFKKGKVREVYDFNDKLLIVATDNVSAFDVVLPTLIKGKGIILNQISNFWFDFSKKNIKNHIISKNVAEFPAACQKYADVIRDRSILVWKTEMIELEAIVRGYLSGSGFKDYQKTGQICGIQLPEGLKESAKLETPIFTPSTKAQEGHDINITESELRKQIDGDVIDKVKEISLQLYSAAADYALKRGIIIADTKFEFGLLNGEIILIDEILTPDSSRFWPSDSYRPGQSQDSYDKQIIRNYLSQLDWDKTPPGPQLPDDIIQKTIEKYQEVYNKLTIVQS